MRGGHRRAADRVSRCATRVPGRRDARARREDVEAAPVIRVGRACVRRRRRADGDCLVHACWRVGAGVGVAVPRCDRIGHAGADGLADRVVEGRGGAAA